MKKTTLLLILLLAMTLVLFNGCTKIAHITDTSISSTSKTEKSNINNSHADKAVSEIPEQITNKISSDEYEASKERESSDEPAPVIVETEDINNEFSDLSEHELMDYLKSVTSTDIVKATFVVDFSTISSLDIRAEDFAMVARLFNEVKGIEKYTGPNPKGDAGIDIIGLQLKDGRGSGIKPWGENKIFLRLDGLSHIWIVENPQKDAILDYLWKYYRAVWEAESK